MRNLITILLLCCFTLFTISTPCYAHEEGTAFININSQTPAHSGWGLQNLTLSAGDSVALFDSDDRRLVGVQQIFGVFGTAFGILINDFLSSSPISSVPSKLRLATPEEVEMDQIILSGLVNINVGTPFFSGYRLQNGTLYPGDEVSVFDSVDPRLVGVHRVFYEDANGNFGLVINGLNNTDPVSSVPVRMTVV